MSQYKDLLKQREELEAKIAEARNAEVASAIAQVRQLVLDYSLTERDVFGGVRTSSAKGSTVAPKYKDPVTGATWTGRGKPPRWIADKEREQFLIS
jgi:DNA-binding protein H-NS